MDMDLDNIKFREIKDINFRNLFPDLKPTVVTLNCITRRKVIKTIDEQINMCVSGLKLIADNLKGLQTEDSGFSKIIIAIHSFFFFTLQTTADCWVAFKYFVLAKNDYDRSYMRGKLKVILNEGFKKLYGFSSKGKEESEWAKLSALLSQLQFPRKIYLQYQQLTNILERQSQISSWWKEERNIETHFDSFKLYESRQEVINESKVMIDASQLLNALDAVGQFADNLNICIVNFLLFRYKRGELRIE